MTARPRSPPAGPATPSRMNKVFRVLGVPRNPFCGRARGRSAAAARRRSCAGERRFANDRC